MIADVTGILLAGGKSRRMGEDKRFLSVGERTLFERSLAALRSILETVCVVIAQDSPPLQADVPVFLDLVPNCGSLGGLYTGLREAHTGYVFLAACDMPFLNPEAVRYLVSLKDQADIVMVQLESGLQPTHAVYSQRCLPIIEEMVHAHQVKLQYLAANPSLHVRLVTESELREIDSEGRSFLNVNTPADLDAARKIHVRRTNLSSST
jgi:molybdopterin-guanine dinucleotide biosynthesis protein A